MIQYQLLQVYKSTSSDIEHNYGKLPIRDDFLIENGDFSNQVRSPFTKSLSSWAYSDFFMV